jgi:hypothetical protein
MISNHLALQAEDTVRIEIVVEPFQVGCTIEELFVELSYCIIMHLGTPRKVGNPYLAGRSLLFDSTAKHTDMVTPSV